MIEKLFYCFGINAVHKICTVFNVVSQVLKVIDQEFHEDKQSRNTAIDAIVELLQKHKDVIPPSA